jgi:hypothetical protein
LTHNGSVPYLQQQNKSSFSRSTQLPCKRILKASFTTILKSTYFNDQKYMFSRAIEKSKEKIFKQINKDTVERIKNFKLAAIFIYWEMDIYI